MQIFDLSSQQLRLYQVFDDSPQMYSEHYRLVQHLQVNEILQPHLVL